MAQQTIGIGSVADDGTGDPHRTALDKCNDNFTELYARLVFSGALVGTDTGQAISSDTLTAVTLGTAAYDVGGWFSAGTPTRLTVPAGVTRVRLTGGLRLTASSDTFAAIYKNGAAAPGLPQSDTDSLGTESVSFRSAVVSVTAGDYFELYCQSASATTIEASGATWLGIEAIE